jgi:putative transposase
MKLTSIHQYWLADITCVGLKAEFVSLAMIIDGFSRKALA